MSSSGRIPPLYESFVPATTTATASNAIEPKLVSPRNSIQRNRRGRGRINGDRSERSALKETSTQGVPADAANEPPVLPVSPSPMEQSNGKQVAVPLDSAKKARPRRQPRSKPVTLQTPPGPAAPTDNVQSVENATAVEASSEVKTTKAFKKKRAHSKRVKKPSAPANSTGADITSSPPAAPSREVYEFSDLGDRQPSSATEGGGHKFPVVVNRRRSKTVSDVHGPPIAFVAPYAREPPPGLVHPPPGLSLTSGSALMPMNRVATPLLGASQATTTAPPLTFMQLAATTAAKPASASEFYQLQHQSLYDYHRSLEYHMAGQREHPVLAGKLPSSGIGVVAPAVGGVRIPTMMDAAEYHRQREGSVPRRRRSLSEMRASSPLLTAVQPRDVKLASSPVHGKSSQRKPNTETPSKSRQGKQSKASSSHSSSAATGSKTSKGASTRSRSTTQNQPRYLFDRYLDSEEVGLGLAQGTLVKGQLRINRRRRQDAYVAIDGDDHDDIFIHGGRARNRALDGDTVIVELLAGDDLWEAKTEKEEQDSVRTSTYAAQGKIHANGRSVTLVEEGEDLQDTREWGKVVAVAFRDANQCFAGQLLLERPGVKLPEQAKRRQGVPRMLWFKPVDIRVPLMAVAAEDVPREVLGNPTAYSDKLFVVRIKKWPPTSHHPFATVDRLLGAIGEIESETQALLADNNVITDDFSDKAKACLPEVPWSIPSGEYTARLDLRERRIFSVDPLTAKDLDDALSCKRLPDGNFEIGVHIADVSFFIKPGSILDREAKARATSVYLVQRVIPMLPALLCEELCSLNPGVERLSFSVMWILSPRAEILSTWFGRTIIKSCGKLAYEHAQEVIEGNHLPACVALHGHDRVDVESDILLFDNLAKILRSKRFEDGALSINSVKLSYTLDSDGNPSGCRAYQQRDSNKMIEEFMLLANISVAKKIAQQFTDQSLLRRHAPPIEKRLDEFILLAERLGYSLDASSAGALQRSFNSIENEHVEHVLKLLAIKPMHRAKYFCSGTMPLSDYAHYALNVPLYTHFTSPIRRYADVMVHRLLQCALDERKFYMSQDDMKEVALGCNTRKDSAKSAQDQSDLIYLAVYIHMLTLKEGPVYAEGVIVDCKDHSFDVVVPAYGIEKRVYLDKLPLESSSWDEKRACHTLFWKRDVDPMSVIMEDLEDMEQSGMSTESDNDVEAILAELEKGEAEATDAMEDEVVNSANAVPGPSPMLITAVDELDVKEPPAATHCQPELESTKAPTLVMDEPSQEHPTPAANLDLRRPQSATIREAEQTSRGSTPQSLQQEVKIFERLQILITADISRSPAIINLVPLHPHHFR